MGIIKVAGKNIEVGEDDYLVNRSDWNEEVAMALARVDGIELTPEHWEVIHFLRDFYEEHQYTPHMRMLPKVIEKKLGPNKGNNKYLYGLFPYGPLKQGCKYAGLPRQCFDP